MPWWRRRSRRWARATALVAQYAEQLFIRILVENPSNHSRVGEVRSWRMSTNFRSVDVKSPLEPCGSFFGLNMNDESTVSSEVVVQKCHNYSMSDGTVETDRVSCGEVSTACVPNVIGYWDILAMGSHPERSLKMLLGTALRCAETSRRMLRATRFLPLQGAFAFHSDETVKL